MNLGFSGIVYSRGEKKGGWFRWFIGCVDKWYRREKEEEEEEEEKKEEEEEKEKKEEKKEEK